MNIGIRTIILIILGVIGIFALVYGSVYSVPDAVEVRYGLPLSWGANIISTIAGPVDLWRVDLIRLAVDVAFWFTVLIAASAILNYRRGKPKATRTRPEPIEKTK
jgi:hypothetical protein